LKASGPSLRKECEQGDLTFSEGDPADYAYFVEAGQVSVSIRKFGRQERICTLGPGACFGKMALFSNDTRNAPVTAATDVSLLSADKGQL
jgi:CRP-like cAMP-binding protein